MNLGYHIIIMDIQNYFGYPKMYLRISINRFSDIHNSFWISKNRFMDILKYIFGYPKIMLNFGYP